VTEVQKFKFVQKNIHLAEGMDIKTYIWLQEWKLKHTSGSRNGY
jgi:hypothetical protein